MDRKLHVMALAGILFLFLIPHRRALRAQNQARADIKNAEGKSVGTASLRETKDGVVMTVNVKGLPARAPCGPCSTRWESAKRPAFTSAGPSF